MTEISSGKDALDEVRKIDGVLDAALVARSGQHIYGGPMQGIHRETFAAMAAVILGAAETAASDVDQKVSKVAVGMEDSNLVLLPAGPRNVMSLVLRGDVDVDEVSSKALKMISLAYS